MLEAGVLKTATCDCCGQKVEGPNDLVSLKVKMSRERKTALDLLQQGLIDALSKRTADKVFVASLGMNKDFNLVLALQFETFRFGKNRKAATFIYRTVAEIATDQAKVAEEITHDVEEAFKELEERS